MEVQISLTVSEAKRLIAKAVVQLPEIKEAMIRACSPPVLFSAYKACHF